MTAMTPQRYDDVRYLLAKRSVDDRALDRGVLAALQRRLGALALERPRVLELGAGVGTMVERLVRWEVLQRAHYTLVDRDRAGLAAARDHLLASFAGARARDDGVLSLRPELTVELVEAELVDWLGAGGQRAPFELVIANAVLDLVDVPSLLPRLWRTMRPAHPYWFTINFDGETILLPERALDASVMALYHRSMDTRAREESGARAGDSRCGRHLLEQLPASGARITAAAGSDWVVLPDDGEDGAYPGDEAYFLHHIVHTIDAELRGHAELDASAFDAWVRARHRDIERGALRYVAHQLDVTGLSPASR